MDLQHLVKPKISEFCEFTEKKDGAEPKPAKSRKAASESAKVQESSPELVAVLA